MNNTFKVGLFDELDSIYPDTDASDGVESYHLSCGGGSFAGVHIMLSGLTPGIPVTFEVRGPNKAYKLFELIPLPVEVNSSITDRTEWLDSKHNPYVIRRAPFSVYDVLRPCTNILTPKGVSTAVAFRCKVNGDEHRFSSWEFYITSCGITKKLLLCVEEFKVTIPPADQKQHKYVNWLGENTITQYHHAELFSDKWYHYLESYLRLAHYGRQNMFCLWVDWFYDKNGCDTPILNEKKLDRLIEIADRTGMYYLSGGTMTFRKNDDWDATTVTLKHSLQDIPGQEGEKQLYEMACDLNSYLEKHDLKKRWFQSFMDEPEYCKQEKTYRLGTDIIKKAMPNVPILEAVLSDEPIAGALDVWCPVNRAYEQNIDFYNARFQKGDRIFVYTCLQPTGNYLNRLLDNERIRPVLIGWAPAKYTNIEGFLHWGGNFLSGIDPTYLSAPLGDITDYDLDRKTVLPAGDSAIMFPGFNEVLSSTRLEAHRIGFEDLALLSMLPKDQKDTLVSSMFTSYNEYVKDISVYRTIKRKLLELSEDGLKD